MALSACSDEPDAGTPAREDGYAYITLSLQVPEEASSRAYDAPLDYDTQWQKSIDPDDVYVIFYDTNDKIVEIPYLTKLDNNQSTLATVAGKVKIRTDAIKFRVLANVAQCGTFGTDTAKVRTKLKEYVGKSDEDLCKALQYNGFNADGKWDTRDKYLPMQSAMSSDIVLNTDRRLSVDMYRSLAKIGVVFFPDKDADAISSFKLTKVRVYNQHTYGQFISHVTPSTDIYTQYQSPYVLEESPSRSDYVEYSVPDTTLLEEIFVPEHINDGTHKDIRLQVAFDETNVLTKETVERCYDLYFTSDALDNTITSDNKNERYDVIRNHSYIFKIRRIAQDIIVDLQPYTVVDLNPDFGLERDEYGNLIRDVISGDGDDSLKKTRYIIGNTDDDNTFDDLVRIEYYKRDTTTSPWELYEQWEFSYAFADEIDGDFAHVELYKYHVDSEGEKTLFEIAKLRDWEWDTINNTFLSGRPTSIWEYANASEKATRGYRFSYTSTTVDNTTTYTVSEIVRMEYEYYDSWAYKQITTWIYSQGVADYDINADSKARLEFVDSLTPNEGYPETYKFDEDTGEL